MLKTIYAWMWQTFPCEVLTWGNSSAPCPSTSQLGEVLEQQVAWAFKRDPLFHSCFRHGCFLSIKKESPVSAVASMVASWETLLLLLANLVWGAIAARPCSGSGSGSGMASDVSYCLSWRVAVEANNAQAWRTVPAQCTRYVEDYMLGGQYNRDLDTAIDQVFVYLNGTLAADDGMDAWILDVDDTCLSNLLYYKDKHFGGDPYDPLAFKSWAQKGVCPAIPAVLQLYKRLIEKGFKVFLLTGRDEVVFSSSTSQNLHAQGFTGHERLILRNQAYRGQGAAVFKSAIRKQLVSEGYRIRGNIGDQWSDLSGDCIGNRLFKLPNPIAGLHNPLVLNK
ncbi:acid phosphatase [Musa troglodytarum]|uniref:Acid phosphatase n=1 Tax=Musa troglodytarum TaxID=320322 RepID=A0A9E7KNV1_9LILI|nr:acid phosphatase [Musa troglodytarum]